MDLSSLKLDLGPKKREIDPIQIFGGLTQRGQVETLYGPQQEALKQWHNNCRSKSDVLISMNTGGGKTLVGLLAAQSLVNELRAKVLYVCPTNQLVQQTAAQARDCGIKVATYGDRTWSNEDEFDAADCCCITNYHAVFRGGSSFNNDSVRAVLFDDAHVAPATIRDCFTLTIPAGHAAWAALIGIFKTHFEKTPFATRFDRFTQKDKREGGTLFVPAWLVWDNRKAIENVLGSTGIDSKDSPTRFAFRHLRDHISHCAFFICQDCIEITPPVLPTHSLAYFRKDVRRIYLTATLPSRYECIRTFGIDRAETVSPSGKIGAAQRLFVFPYGDGSVNPYDQTRELVAQHKACIIVPSKFAAKKWEDIGKVYDSKEGHKAIVDFANASDTRKMILAGLFDGIDLPGKACKVLVLDGIPKGACLHDQFMEAQLDSKKFRLSQTAGRLTQAIGRIFRSNTDHGVVILADRTLQSWLRQPDNMSYLPPLLQQQVLLGSAIRKSLEDGPKEKAYPSLMLKVIDGTEDWDKLYNTRLAEIATEQKPKEPKWGDVTARAEFDAWQELWEGRNHEAARLLNRIGDELSEPDAGLAAWSFHWCGVACLHEGNVAAASVAFRRAANIKSVLGRYGSTLPPSAGLTTVTVSKQTARAIAAAKGELESRATVVLTKLKGSGGVNADDHEQALCDLGILLGLEASRPGKSTDNKGPDVAWLSSETNHVVGLEAKTQKSAPAVYKKKDIGQAHDSREWLLNTFPKLETREIWIIGDLGDVVIQANPSPDMKIVTRESMIDLAERILNAARRIAVRSHGVAIETAAQEAFEYYGLLWPQLAESLDFRIALDLQDGAISDDE